MQATPDYLRIVRDIERHIETGEWRPGDKLPTNRELADQYEVSMGTVDRALTVLKHTGHLVGRQGRGVYVAGVDPDG